MQSEARKNPYLVQYKNSVGAQQKAIRQRLGQSTEDNSPTASARLPAIGTSLDRNDSIPSIDDDTANQVSQERRYKSRYSYFDIDAEESLQFFKKNLLPTSATTSETITQRQQSRRFQPTTSSSYDRKSDVPSGSYMAKEDFSGQQRLRAPLEESKSSESNYKYPVVSTRPVPFKQTSLNEPTRFESHSTQPRAQVSASNNNNNNNSNNFNHNLYTRQPSTSRTSLDKLTAVEQAPIASVRQRSSERQKSGSNKYDRQDEQPVPTTRAIATSTPKVPDSPIPSEAFARKPLYNSLLRAHDSIRLKVNRPKVRPKSEVVVPDTEIDDGGIELEELSPSTPSLTNERAIDVKRRSSKKKSKKKEQGEVGEEEKVPVRNFSEVRIVKVIRNEAERSLGVTVRAEDGNIVVARILAGSLADKQGALQVGDVILSVNNREVYTPEQLQEQLKRTINDDTVIMKIVPSFREELPTLCLYLRALFNYDANEDSLLPCKEVGVSFNQGDILEVVNQEDPNWWQARRVDSENLQTGLIPSQELEERRRAFVIPDYDLATRTSICGTRVSKKSKKKEIYNVGQNCDFDKAELQLYEEVCRTPAFERRTLVLVGANGVGKQAFKARLVGLDPERFGTPLPHTSRLTREGEEDGIHYHFVTRERMEEDIIEGKYLEYGEYDGALYGTKLDSIREIIGSGRVCVLDCSPTCLKVLKTSDYLPFVAFIAAPTLDQLRYMHEWNRGNKTYTTLDRALSRQSRRAKTLQDFAFDFFEDEDLQVTVEESARLFRMYENYFDIVLVNDNFERTFNQLREAIDALSMAPQWIPISWIYGT